MLTWMSTPDGEHHPRPNSERAEGKPPLILLVEDDPDLRETTALLSSRTRHGPSS
jgi:hypothetical protein